MAISQSEIIEDLELHIRKSGGEPREWCAGTAKDARGPFFQRHAVAELEDGLAYREAYTPSGAANALDHLVREFGLRLDREAVPEPGKIVFVYRPGA